MLCDIDDTLTWEGRLVPEALVALQRLQQVGLKVVPVTGRPAGWVDHLARMWPVDGVVGENGGLWFYMERDGLVRRFAQAPDLRQRHRTQLTQLAERILTEVPGAALASDQPYRALDLAIDFCEDVPPLPTTDIERIVEIFQEEGATCKVSSIHVNGWFGSFTKRQGVEALLGERWGLQPDDIASRWLYVGDSPNDEPMFEMCALSVGVANVAHFLPQMTSHPRWITAQPGGHGFAELVDHLLGHREAQGEGSGTSAGSGAPEPQAPKV